MASTPFFDPIVALRHTPLVSTTCTLLFAYEHLDNASSACCSAVFTVTSAPQSCYLPCSQSSPMRMFEVLGFLSLTAVSSLSNLYWHTDGSFTLGERGSYCWYAAPAALAVGGPLYVSSISKSVLAIEEQRDAQKERDMNNIVDDWLTVNRLWTPNVDVAAWFAAMIAVGNTFKA